MDEIMHIIKKTSKIKASKLICDECSESVNAVVSLGEDPDTESRTACICVDCLKDAMYLMEQYYTSS